MTNKEMLEALKKKLEAGTITEEEKAKLEALEQELDENESSGEKTYSEAYVKQLREENAKRRKKLKEYEEMLAKYDGINPDEYEELKSFKEQIEKEKLEKAGEFDKLKEKMVQEFGKEKKQLFKQLEEANKKYSQLEAEFNNMILSNAVITEAVKAEAFNPDVIKLAIMQEAKIEVDDNGNRIIKLYENGQEKINYKTGKPLTIAERIEEMKQDERFAFMFKGGITGAGSTQYGVGGANFKNPFSKEHFNLTEQGKIWKENPELAQRLKAQAEKQNK